MNESDKDEVRYIVCVWCGNWISRGSYSKRKERKLEDADSCKDCRDVAKYTDAPKFRKVSRTHATLGKIECLAWNGDLDDDWNPIDENGELFRPGERICGAKDCIDIHHVITPKKSATDYKLLIAMHEMQEYNKKVRANNGL